MPKSLYDRMRATYDAIVPRRAAQERARDVLYAQDKRATLRETMENAYDRLHPEEAPPDQLGRPQPAAGLSPASPTITGGDGTGALVGADGTDGLVDPYTPKYATPFYDGIGEREAGAKGHRALNNELAGGAKKLREDWAWGRYGMTVPNLAAMGMMDATGNWTGMLDIKEDEEFLSNKNQIQERVLDAYLENMEHLSQDNLKHVGRTNGRRILAEGGANPPLAITEAGLMAAAHRAGRGWVRQYLEWLDSNGGETAGKPFPDNVHFPKNGRTGEAYSPKEIEDWLRAVETRLRLFERTPYRR